MGQLTNGILSAAKWGNNMSNILYYATIVLSAAGALFALVYLIMNAIGRADSLAERNAITLGVTRASMILSLIFALLICLLGDSSMIEKAIDKTDTLYTIIAIIWLGVIVACGVAVLCTIIFKKTYTWTTAHPIARLFRIALIGASIALVLAWLLA
jgi:uncharacterized membrane protein YjfL (UPF0719 family)